MPDLSRTDIGEREDCACLSGLTVPDMGKDMERCLHCGTSIRWDLVDDPFWGFKAGCDEWQSPPPLQP